MKRILNMLLKLLLVLVAVSHGMASSCNSTDGETLLQYGALGESVYIHVTNTSPENLNLEVFFQCIIIFEYKNKIGKFENACVNNCHFLNGTIKLDFFTKTLAGIYKIDEYYSNGLSTGNRKINLIIQGNQKGSMIPVVLGTSFLTAVLLLGAFYLYKKKRRQLKTCRKGTSEKSTSPCGTSDNPQELVYCQVQVGKKKECSKKQQQEPQVVYGEVTVSDNSKVVRHTARKEEDTVYSGIRT